MIGPTLHPGSAIPQVAAIDLNRPGGSGEPPLPLVVQNRSLRRSPQFHLVVHLLNQRPLLFEFRSIRQIEEAEAIQSLP
jgi:hypothetical protein